MNTLRWIVAAVLFAVTLGGCGGGGGGGSGGDGNVPSGTPSDPPVPADVDPPPPPAGTGGTSPVPAEAAVFVGSLGTVLTSSGRVASPATAGGLAFEDLPPVRALAEDASGFEYAVTAAGALMVRSAASGPDGGPLSPILGSDPVQFTAVAPFAPAGAPSVAAEQASFSQWHALVVTRAGMVWSAGSNQANQLARVPTDDGTTFAPVTVLAGVRAVAAVWDAGLALLGNGQVVSWGGSWVDSISGVILGRGAEAVAASAVPLTVPGLSPIGTIAPSMTTIAALGTDGSVWAWGYFLCSTDTMLADPVRVAFPAGVVVTRIGASIDGVVALDADGHLWYAGSVREPDSGQCTAFSTTAVPLATAIDGADPATRQPIERIVDVGSSGGLYPTVRGVSGALYTLVRRASVGAADLTVSRQAAPVLP